MIHITMGGSTMVLIAVLQTEAFCVVQQMVALSFDATGNKCRKPS